MKRKQILLLLILILISGNNYCQNFNAGAKAGLSIIPLEKHDLKGNMFSLGYQFGATGSYKINNWFSISAEILFSNQKKTYEKFDTSSFIETIASNPLLSIIGVNINELIDSLGMASGLVNDNVCNSRKAVTKLAYIKIPVLANFNYKSVYFSVGPYVSFLVSDKTTEEFSQHIPIIESFTGLDTIPFYTSIINSSFPGYSEPLSTTSEKDKTIRKVDFGIIADISYHLDNNFIFGFRYEQGLLNYRSPEIYKKDYLSSFNFYVGYTLNFKDDTKSLY